MSDQPYKVWQARIYVPADTELPWGADFPPRRACIDTVENMGIEVVACFSGWNAPLDESEVEYLKWRREVR